MTILETARGPRITHNAEEIKQEVIDWFKSRGITPTSFSEIFDDQTFAFGFPDMGMKAFEDYPIMELTPLKMLWFRLAIRGWELDWLSDRTCAVSPMDDAFASITF